MMNKDRNIFFDYCKGVLIFTIVWGHLSLGWLLDEIINPIVLCLFFMFSGYFTKDESIGAIAKSRLKSLLWPFLLFVAVGYVFHFCFTTFVEHKTFNFFLPFQEFANGVDFSINIPLWFLFALYAMTLIHALINRITQYSGWICLIMSIIGMILLKDFNFNNFYLGKVFTYLYAFHFGYHIRRKPIIIKRIILALFVLIFCILLSIVKIRYVANPIFDYIIGYAVAIMLFVLVVNSENFAHIFTRLPFSRVITYFGMNSLVILCFHIISNFVIYHILYYHFGVPGFGASFMYACISMFFCIPAIIIYNRWLRLR